MKYTLRPYQQIAVDAGVKCLQENDGNNGLIVLPTGSGKSLVISTIANVIGGKTLILQPSKEILEQNFKKIIELGQSDVGIYSASLNSKAVRTVTFATIGSIYEKPELFEEFNQIIVDECDLVNATDGMYKQFFDALEKPVLGFTASPWRLTAGGRVGMKRVRGGAMIPIYAGSINKILTRTKEKVFHKILHVTQIKELYDLGFLCPLKYVEGVMPEQTKLSLNSTGNDYTDATYKRISKNIVKDAVNAVIDTKANSNIIFTKRIEDAEEIVERLRNYGRKAEVLTGTTKPTERERIIEQLISGEIQDVANVGVLTVGFDHPALDHIVLARPLNSIRLYYQIKGRGIRIHPSKEFCTLTDLCGNVDRLGKIEDWILKDNNGDGKWRLYNINQPLTGVDLKSGEDLENPENNGVVIHFGKHKGTAIKQAPTSYLEWIRDNFSAGEFRNHALDELSKRAVGGVK